MSDINIKMCFSDHLAEIQNLSKEITEVSDSIGHDENLNSFALGGKSKVKGENAVAMGLDCEANGKQSVAIGTETKAAGNHSFASGSETIASGVASHAEGAKYESNRNTESAGQASHAEGASTYAKADGSHAEGILNIAGRFLDEIRTAAQELGISGTPQELAAKLLGYGAHAEGMNNKALGSCSHSEGNATKALANSTHAEGDTTIAFGEASHAEGYNTQAKGNQSHAEGSNTIATGNSAHAEGVSTVASGSFSHAEGSHTEAIGRDSHAEGAYNKAIGIASHAEGEHNIAKNQAQHVSGKYATIDESGKAIFQVGIGESDAQRKDALRVTDDGSIFFRKEDEEVLLQEQLDSLNNNVGTLQERQAGNDQAIAEAQDNISDLWDSVKANASNAINDVSLSAIVFGSKYSDVVYLKAPSGKIKLTDKIIFARYIKNKTRPRWNYETDKSKERKIYKGWIRPLKLLVGNNQWEYWMGDNKIYFDSFTTKKGYDYFLISAGDDEGLINFLYNNSSVNYPESFIPRVVDKKLGIKIVRDGITIVDYIPFTIKESKTGIPRFGRI